MYDVIKINELKFISMVSPLLIQFDVVIALDSQVFRITISMSTAAKCDYFQ